MYWDENAATSPAAYQGVWKSDWAYWGLYFYGGGAQQPEHGDALY